MITFNDHEYACMSTQLRQRLQRLAIEQHHFREADKAFEDFASVDDILSPEEFENTHGRPEMAMEIDGLSPMASEPGGPVNPDAVETLPFDPVEACLVETRFTEGEVVEIEHDTPSPKTPTPKTPSPRARLERTETEDKDLDPKKKKIDKSDHPAPGKELGEKVAHMGSEETKDVLPEGEDPNAHGKSPDEMSKQYLLEYKDRAHDHLQPLPIIVMSLCPGAHTSPGFQGIINKPPWFPGNN